MSDEEFETLLERIGEMWSEIVIEIAMWEYRFDETKEKRLVLFRYSQCVRSFKL